MCERMWCRRRVFPLDTYTPGPWRGNGGAGGRRTSTPHKPWLPDLLQGEETKSFSRTPPTLPGNCNAGSPSVRSGCAAPRAGMGVCPSVAGVRCFTPLPQSPVKWLYNPDLSVYWGQRKSMYVWRGEEGGQGEDGIQNSAKCSVH